MMLFNNKIYNNKYKIIYCFIFLILLFTALLYINNKNKIVSILEAASDKKTLISQIENTKQLLLHSTQDQSKLLLATMTENKPLSESGLIDYFALFFHFHKC